MASREGARCSLLDLIVYNIDVFEFLNSFAVPSHTDAGQHTPNMTPLCVVCVLRTERTERVAAVRRYRYGSYGCWQKLGAGIDFYMRTKLMTAATVTRAWRLYRLYAPYQEGLREIIPHRMVCGYTDPVHLEEV